MFMRSGASHGIQFPGRDPSIITVPCYSCPWPGVNLPTDFKTTDVEMRQVS